MDSIEKSDEYTKYESKGYTKEEYEYIKKKLENIMKTIEPKEEELFNLKLSVGGHLFLLIVSGLFLVINISFSFLYFEVINKVLPLSLCFLVLFSAEGVLSGLVVYLFFRYWMIRRKYLRERFAIWKLISTIQEIFPYELKNMETLDRILFEAQLSKLDIATPRKSKKFYGVD